MSDHPPSPSNPPVEATFRLGAGTHARITVELLDEDGQAQETGMVELRASPAQPLEETLVFQKPTASPVIPSPILRVNPTLLLARLRQNMKTESGLATGLFILGLVIYFGGGVIGLPNYPISFLVEEARPTLLALDLVQANFVYEGTTLPTFFLSDRGYNLGTTVYLNILPALLLGKSVWVVRGMAVLLSFLAAVSVGLILKQIFVKPYWWIGPLLLSITPVWFLHSRMGLETIAAASFFAAFLYFYLRYRTDQPQALYYALIFGALTFYTYPPAQLVMLVMGLLLFLTDFRYHLANWQVMLRGAGLLVLFAFPFVRFRLAHPTSLVEDLQIAHVYLSGDVPWAEKVHQAYRIYLAHLNPLYWYFPTGMDTPIHMMGKHAHLLWITLPFALIGVVDAGQYFETPAWRVLILAGVAAPVGAVLSLQGVEAVLFFVIPITLLTALGIIKGLEWGEALYVIRRRRSKVFHPVPVAPSHRLQWGIFGVLAVSSGLFLIIALVKGPSWTTDYSLSGMQYGGRQVFAEIQETLLADPNVKIKLSPDWAIGLPTLARFFLGDPIPVEFESLAAYVDVRREIKADALFVLPLYDFIQLSDTNKFVLNVTQEITDPTGAPFMVFTSVEYVPNIEEILAEETAARRILLDGSATFEGTTIPVRYPKLDMGEIPNALDGNNETLIRTAEANPLILELYLPEVRLISGMDLQIGATLAQITVKVFPELNADPLVFTQELEGTLDAPTVEMDFGETVTGSIIRIEIQDMRQEEPGHVHLWEVQLR